MNAAHLHLLLNHLPIFGLIFATVWLAVAIVLKKPLLRNAALISLVVVGIFTVPAYLTGEPAEEIVEESYGRNHQALHEHEEAAFPALLITLLAAAAAGAAWFMNRSDKFAWLNWLTLALAVVAIVAMARVGSLGGEISHPEVGGSAPTESMEAEGDDD